MPGLEQRILKFESKDLKMLRPSHLGLSCVLFFSYPVAHAESPTNKCTDGYQVTYANMPCEKLGLKTIGPVKNSITVVPATQKSEENLSENSGKQDGEKNDASAADAAETGNTNSAKSLIEKIMR
jgi:hypothetical protein